MIKLDQINKQKTIHPKHKKIWNTPKKKVIQANNQDCVIMGLAGMFRSTAKVNYANTILSPNKKEMIGHEVEVRINL